MIFANKIDSEGRPICPMVGCHEPVEAGEGQAFTVDPAKTLDLFMLGLLAQGEGLVIVHSGCVL